MELVYLWIEGIGIIQDQKFPFSSEFDIKFDFTSKKLEISRSNRYKVKIFDDIFLNITAIIGKNGSGKTSLLTFIKTLFSDSFYYSHYRYVLVLKEVSTNNIIIIDKFSRGEETVFDKNELEDGTPVKIVKNCNDLTRLVDLICHSNSFSIYERDTFGPKFYDYSFGKSLDLRSIKSNELLIESYNNLKNEYKDKPDDDDFEASKNRLIYFNLPKNLIYHYDLQSNVNFISEHTNNNFGFVPKVIDISFNRDFFYNNQEYLGKLGLGPSLERIEFLLFNAADDLSIQENSPAPFIERILVSLFLFFVIHERFYYPRNTELHSAIEAISSVGSIDEIPKIIKSFFEDSKVTSGEDPILKIKEFVSTLDTQFNSYKEFQSHYSNYYSLRANDEVCKSLNKIFEIWLDNDFIFSFGWHDLSAGESALLTLFSRIHALSKVSYYKEYLWIQIDEGDLYLHPEWQRTFLHDLHKYLPLFFKDTKGIQLFLTSHSPFLVSDLPKENIILLNRDDESGLCKVVPQDNLKATFGANIHELLAHSFFMDHGTIGEFARGKINELIKYIKEEGNSPFNSDEEAQSLIDIIGEPIIKNKLQSMLNAKRSDEDLIRFHEKEIERIKARQDDKD